MIEETTISNKDIEKVYSQLHIQQHQSNHQQDKQESFESIAGSFRWPKMFYPSLYPSKNNISSSANSLVIEK